MGSLTFTWDQAKEKLNLTKHGVGFKEACEIFDDPLHLAIIDKRFDYFEERWVTLGMTKGKHLLVVGHLYTIEPASGAETIRVISARKATTKERHAYENTDRKKRKQGRL